MGNTSGPHEPLEIGRILSDALALVFGNLGPMLTIGAIPAIGSASIGVALFGTTRGAADLYAAGGTAPSGAAVVIGIVDLLLWGFATAAVTQAALDARSGTPVDPGRAFRTGIRRLGPAVLVSLLASIGIWFGLMALVVPGLWLMAVWSVVLPATVVERLGLDAFTRSAELTRDYRWPLVGLILLYSFAALGISLVAGVLQVAALGLGTAGVVIATLIGVGIGALLYALTGALVVLTYARLRKLKEGTTLDALADALP